MSTFINIEYLSTLYVPGFIYPNDKRNSGKKLCCAVSNRREYHVSFDSLAKQQSVAREPFKRDSASLARAGDFSQQTVSVCHCLSLHPERDGLQNDFPHQKVCIYKLCAPKYKGLTHIW